MLDIDRAEKLQSALKDNNVSVFAYDSTASTNLCAREYAKKTRAYTPVLFVAREQTGGRGRLGRSFLSQRDRGIYMSVLYFTKSELSDAVSVTTAAAVFVASAIERASGRECKIKWVNDIYTVDGKVSGILAETLSIGERTAVIVGIGINHGEGDFPEELCGIAASVGKMDDNTETSLIAEITEALLLHASTPGERGYMNEYRRRFMLDGAFVDIFRAGERMGSGRVIGVSDDGGLLFVPEGEETCVEIRTGEVSVRSIERQRAE